MELGRLATRPAPPVLIRRRPAVGSDATTAVTVLGRLVGGAASTGASWRRSQIRRASVVAMRLDGSPAGTPSTRPQSRTARENILVFNAGLGSTSSPAPAGKAARGPRTAARFARAARRAPCRKDEMRPPSRTARDGVELPSFGTGQPPRAAGAFARGRPSRRAVLGPASARRRYGRALLRLAPRGGARAVAATPTPRVGAASCRGLGPTVRARRVQSFLGPATRRWSSCRSTRTAGADERAARGRKPPPRHRRDVVLVTASARRRASRPTHTRERASTRGDRAPPAQWTSTAR